MFKVVETIEKNGKNLSVIPATWEKNTTLFWPSNMKVWEIDKLRKNSKSVAGLNWTEMPCKVKAIVDSFEEGISVEKLLASFSDTESEERYNAQLNQEKMKNSRIRKPLQSKNNKKLDYNTMVEQSITAENDEIECGEQTAHLIEDIVNNENIMYDTVFLPNISLPPEMQEAEETITNNEITVQSLLLEIRNDIQNMKVEIQNLNKKQENFEKVITKEMGELNVKVDRLLSQNQNLELTNDGDLHLTKEIIFPLKQVEEINAVEKMLENDSFKKEMITRLSNICGTNRTADGVKSMYKLVDFLFEPNLLTKFSWTGISKTGNKKNCFQKLSNVVELMFQLVFLSDCRHSRQRNEEFLKEKILKHANQRLIRKRKIEDDEQVTDENRNPEIEIQSNSKFSTQE